ncbi:hypothetical protein [Streptomyces virginiae]|uniref:hypothetical protein n=1 Tax=Streptomyces virginiae TaxID=1961 RepID=UPI00331D5A40
MKVLQSDSFLTENRIGYVDGFSHHHAVIRKGVAMLKMRIAAISAVSLLTLAGLFTSPASAQATSSVALDNPYFVCAYGSGNFPGVFAGCTPDDIITTEESVFVEVQATGLVWYCEHFSLFFGSGFGSCVHS